MITLEKIGRTYQYKADLDNFLTREWKRIFSLEQIHNANIVKKIIEHKKYSILFYMEALVKDAMMKKVILIY